MARMELNVLAGGQGPRGAHDLNIGWLPRLVKVFVAVAVGGIYNRAYGFSLAWHSDFPYSGMRVEILWLDLIH